MVDAQTKIDLGAQGRNVDFSAASSTKPSKTGTILPFGCSVGEEFFKTDAPAGQNKYGCTAPDTWTLQGGGNAGLPGEQGNDFVATATATRLSTMPGSRMFGGMKVENGGCTFDISGGSITGLAYLYVTDSGQVVLEHPGGLGSLAITASGLDCQAAVVTIPAWPTGMNFHAVATVEVVSGTWGTVSQHPSLSAGWYVACAANLQCSYSNGTIVVDAGANVMTLSGTNAVSGVLDMANAQSFTLPRSAADPGICATGQQYFNTTTAKMKVCTAPNAWSDVGMGSGGVTGSSLAAGRVVIGAGGSSVADSGKTAPAGAFVGDTDAQTLSHKTLDSPVLSGAVAGTVDLSQAGKFVPPSSSVNPASCTMGQQYYNTVSNTVRVCTGPDTWTDLGSGGGGGSGIGKTLPAGELVGDTDTQTLSNKTLSGPVFAGEAGGSLDLSHADRFLMPRGTADPASCAAGQQYYSTTRQTIRICTVPDIWGDWSAELPAGVPACAKHTVSYTDAVFRAAGATVTKVLATIPVNGQITSLRIKHSAAFAGTGITAMTVRMGDGATADVYAPAFNIFAAPDDRTLWDDGGAFGSTAASHSLVATFSANTNFGGGAATALTAGSVDVWVCVRTLP